MALKLGMRVRHPQFGVGTVLSVEALDDDTKLVVRVRRQSARRRCGPNTRGWSRLNNCGFCSALIRGRRDPRGRADRRRHRCVRVHPLPIRMEGISMLPTYSGGINFANRYAYRWSPPQRGDAVAVRMRPGEGVVFVKRIVGMPGERVGIEVGVVMINGEPLIESHVLYKTLWNMPK